MPPFRVTVPGSTLWAPMIRTPSSIIVPPVKSFAPEIVSEPVPVLWKVPGPDSTALMVPDSTTSWDASKVPPTRLPPVK